MKKIQKNLRLHQRRNFLLLEVLIAFFLVVFCIFPLITPHVAIYRDQIEFAEKIGLDHAVSELYALTIEQLQRNTIAWEAIIGGTKFPIPKNSLLSFGAQPLPYEGYFQFSESKHKPDEEKPFMVYLFKLAFKLRKAGKADSKEIEYIYDIFIPRQLPGETPEEDKPAKDKPKENPKEKPKAG